MRSLSPERLLEIDQILKNTVTEAVKNYNATGVNDEVKVEEEALVISVEFSSNRNSSPFPPKNHPSLKSSK